MNYVGSSKEGSKTYPIKSRRTVCYNFEHQQYAWKVTVNGYELPKWTFYFELTQTFLICGQAFKRALLVTPLRYFEESELEELCGSCGLVQYTETRRGRFIMISAKKSSN